MRGSYRYGGTLLIGILIGIGGMVWWDRPAQVVVVPDRPIVINRSDLRPQDIGRIIPEAKPIVSSHRSSGGKVITVAQGKSEIDVQPSDTPQTIPVEAVAVVSERKGELIATIDLFTQKDGIRISIPTTTTTVVATPNKTRWRVGSAIQAGVGLSGSSDRSRSANAILALQWLRRGGGHAEDSTIALLTPTVLIGDRVSVGLQPLQVNLGRPLPLIQDFWIGSTITLDPSSPRSPLFGVALTATF